MVAVGFLSINDQICIHGVKSKLSSTFYQLLQASLIYLSKLFAILTSRDNILKVQISEKKKERKTCPIIEFISPKNTWAIFQTPNKCLSSALFENPSIFHFTVLEKMRLFRAVFKHCAKIGIHFSCLPPPLLKCHFFQDPFFADFTALLTHFQKVLQIFTSLAISQQYVTSSFSLFNTWKQNQLTTET